MYLSTIVIKLLQKRRVQGDAIERASVKSQVVKNCTKHNGNVAARGLLQSSHHSTEICYVLLLFFILSVHVWIICFVYVMIPLLSVCVALCCILLLLIDVFFTSAKWKGFLQDLFEFLVFPLWDFMCKVGKTYDNSWVETYTYCVKWTGQVHASVLKTVWKLVSVGWPTASAWLPTFAAAVVVKHSSWMQVK